MSYLQHFKKHWPTQDKPEFLWTPERGVLWRNEFIECHDHLQGLLELASKWEGFKLWEKYLNNLKQYMK